MTAAECKLALGRPGGALADLDRAQREFPYVTFCATCAAAEAERVQELRAKIVARVEAR